MSTLYLCDKCGTEIKGNALIAVEYEGFRIKWNHPINLATGERADLCEQCVRTLAAQGERAPWFRTKPGGALKD